MSSKYVRDEIAAFLAANSSEKVVDLTGEYEELEDMLDREGIGYADNWIGIQYIGNDEVPINVGATNSSGLYREIGAIFIHIVAPVQLGAANGILDRSETLKSSFRGQRIDDIVIEGVTPPNFESGATLEFEGGFTSASILVNYRRDLNL